MEWIRPSFNLASISFDRLCVLKVFKVHSIKFISICYLEMATVPSYEP